MLTPVSGPIPLLRELPPVAAARREDDVVLAELDERS